MSRARTNADNWAGDITEVQAGTGVSVTNGTGPTPTVTNSMATTIDAKGDLLVGTGDNAFARLPVSANGDTLVADSSTSTGLRWQSANSTNAIINGAFDIWQRGTSFASSGSAYIYTADRYNFVRNSFATGATVSRQSAGLTGIQYCARVARDSGNTSTQPIYFQHTLESADSYRFAGQTATLSFYARAGANYSSASNGLNVNLIYGTGTDQPVQGFTGQTTVVGQTVTLTTSWQRFSITGTVNSAATEIGLWFYFTPSGTAGAADHFEVTGIQLELGSVPTTFRRSAATLAGELAACQRYYFRQTASNGGTGSYLFGVTGNAISTTIIDFAIQHPTTMRIGPTSYEAGVPRVQAWRLNAGYDTGTFTLYGTTPERSTIRYTHGTGVFTINDYCTWVSSGAGNFFLALNAEL